MERAEGTYRSYGSYRTYGIYGTTFLWVPLVSFVLWVSGSLTESHGGANLLESFASK